MAAAGVCLLLWPSLSSSQTSYGTGIDAQENVFGATNINAVVGHGRLTAGISREGDLTVLSWPTPSYGDQLAYASSNALDARARPRFGAPEGAGLFLGLRVVRRDGSSLVTWLRDATAWSVEQSYGTSAGPHPHTTFVSSSLGLRALVVDIVSPTADVLVRSVRVDRSPDSSVVEASLLAYANLSPLPPESRLAELPVVDWILDGRNDYAAVWDESNAAVVHFHPSDQRIVQSISDLLGVPPVTWGVVGDALKRASVSPVELQSIVESLDASYGPGAYAVLTTLPPPVEHQIGFDATPFCDHVEEMIANLERLPTTFPGFTLPLDPGTLQALKCKGDPSQIALEQGWQAVATDALQDSADGVLSGHSIAAGEVNEALRTALEFDASGHAQAAVVLGFGATLADARAAVAAVPSAADVENDSAETVDAWLSGLSLQVGTDELVRTIATRALLALRTGTDDHGAIVASIARQPPYALDWPRDGAFFNVLLDATGQSALVDKRVALYEAWQRDEPVRPTVLVDPPAPVDPDTGESGSYPADAWEMNYYADGVTGGTFRFEIDTTAFAVWSMVAHAGWVADPTTYLGEHWDGIARGANLLARWRDPATGLHAPAQEDDAAPYRQTLHGAVTVFGALDIAARAARLIGRVQEAERWEARAHELRTAMETHFYDPQTGTFFMTDSHRLPIQASGLVPVGPTGWLVWPFTPYDDADPRIARQLDHDWTVIEPVLRLEGKGGLYFMINTVAMAVMGGPPFSDRVQEAPGLLAAQASPGTGHFGEVMVVVRGGDAPRADQRVSVPHLWEGALFALTAIAAQDPSTIRRYDEVLPPSRVRVPPAHSGPTFVKGGCGACGVPLRGSAVSWEFGIVATLALAAAGVMRLRNRDGVLHHVWRDVSRAESVHVRSVRRTIRCAQAHPMARVRHRDGSPHAPGVACK